MRRSVARNLYLRAALVAALLVSVTAALLMGAVCLGLPLPIAEAAVGVEPVSLFALPYGEGDREVGIAIALPREGRNVYPRGFVLGRDGSIAIMDPVNQKVKRFSATGDLLSVTEDALKNLSSAAVNSRGEMCVVWYGGTRLAKFRADGTRIRSEWTEIGVLAERKGGDKIAHEVLEHFGGIAQQFDCVWVDEKDRLCVAVFLFEDDHRLFRFDREDKFLGELARGRYVDEEGRVYRFRRPEEPDAPARVNVLDNSGSSLRELVAPGPSSLDMVLEWVRPRGGSPDWWFADGTGALYGWYIVSRAEWVRLTSDLAIGADYILVKFDERGEVTWAIRVPGELASGPSNLAVSPAGDVYYREFGPEAMTLKMIPASQLQALAGTRELVYIPHSLEN
jgi:hypothetical protein